MARSQDDGAAAVNISWSNASTSFALFDDPVTLLYVSVNGFASPFDFTVRASAGACVQVNLALRAYPDVCARACCLCSCGAALGHAVDQLGVLCVSHDQRTVGRLVSASARGPSDNHRLRDVRRVMLGTARGLYAGEDAASSAFVLTWLNVYHVHDNATASACVARVLVRSATACIAACVAGCHFKPSSFQTAASSSTTWCACHRRSAWLKCE